MTCCPSYNTQFSNVEMKTIPYGDDKRAEFGNVPNIKVYIRDDVTGEYVSLPFFSAQIVGDNVIVDFGGISTGFIKLN